jgi:putative acetyltransferase
MKLRDARPADGEAIRSVVSDTLAEFGFPLESNGVDADLADIAAAYQHDGGVFRVLVDDRGAVVGCGGIYPLDRDTAELRKMYFRPAVRGRGFGRVLLEELVATARANGFRRVVLETASNLTDAIRLYQKFGFVETTDGKHSCRCDRAFALTLE